jgi:hypothetical protein
MKRYPSRGSESGNLPNLRPFLAHPSSPESLQSHLAKSPGLLSTDATAHLYFLHVVMTSSDIRLAMVFERAGTSTRKKEIRDPL